MYADRICEGQLEDPGSRGPSRAAQGRLVAEKASGKNTEDRPQFERMMQRLQPGDVVVVCKLDRLARSSRDLYNILHELAEKGCGFTRLGEGWCDTTTDVGRLLIAVMSGVAEFERSLIRKRCQSGIDHAKAEGKQFGHKPKLDVGQRSQIAERYASGETMAELATGYGVSEPTIWRSLQ